MSLRGTSPLIPVRDIAVTRAFYVDTLGFDHVIDNSAYGYGCFRLGDALIAVTQAQDEAALKATRTNISAQIWVENVDHLWENWQDKLAAEETNGPFDQPYGTRELHIKCPDGFLMMFTQDNSLAA